MVTTSQNFLHYKKKVMLLASTLDVKIAASTHVNSRTWKRLKSYLKNNQWSLSEAAIEHHLENFHKHGHHNPRFGLMWEREVSRPSSDIRLQPLCPSGRWSEVTSFFLALRLHK
jgi:hypothetical protein